MSRVIIPIHSGARRHRFAAVQAALLFLGVVLMGANATAAPTPSSGSLSPSGPGLTWAGGPLAGGNSDETTCQEDLTCEGFTLTVAAGDYTGKKVTVGISWLVLATDYDMYIHENSLSGPVVAQSAQGTTTSEETSISFDPGVLTSARTYVVHVVAFAVAPADRYAGHAEVSVSPAPRIAQYVSSAVTFSPNITLQAPGSTSDAEPSCRVDTQGNAYIGGIRGVPAGVDLWRFDLNPTSPTFDPAMQSPVYLGQPDAFVPQSASDTLAGGADGGGDIDICTSFPSTPGATPIVTITSLAAAEISTSVSTDRGTHFQLYPATVPVPSDDRQWLEADGDSTVYMMYRAPVPATGLFCARSDDHGGTFPLTGIVSASGTTPGYIDVDHSTHTVYIAHTSSSALFVSRSLDRGLTWSTSTVDNSSNHGSLFDIVKVGDDGTVYAVWSDETNIYLAHSTDHGVSWSTKVRVNDNSVYKSCLFPWIEAGSAGRVDIVWYATTSAVNGDTADWVVLFAQSTNATAASPTFAQQQISDHVIHGSNISLGGLTVTGGANRNLLDYFQISLDPQGAAVVAYADDHNDYDGDVFVTRQMDGTSAYATANGSGQVAAVAPPTPVTPDLTAPEVTDFLHDAVAGLLQPVLTDNPFDILSVDYGCSFDSLTSNIRVTATMKVSSLVPVPAGGLWRISFAANAAGGVSDNGDQFYLLAGTTGAAPSFTYGTAVRGGDGNMVYTSRGSADAGRIDSLAGTITMSVSLSKLNLYVTAGPAIGPGSVLQGLRARASSNGANAVMDVTRGGTSYRLTCGLPTGIDAPPARAPGSSTVEVTSLNPSHGKTSIRFRLPRAGHAELSVFDMQGRRVRTIESRTLPAGTFERVWDGRTDHFTDAAPGVYILALSADDGLRTQRVALLR